MKETTVDKMIEDALLKDLEVSYMDMDKHEENINYDLTDLSTPYSLLELQENIMSNPEKFQNISISNNNKEVANIDNSQLVETKAKIQSITKETSPEKNHEQSPLEKIREQIKNKEAQLQKVQHLTESLEQTMNLVKSYKELENTYESNLEKLSETLDKTLGLNSIKISEQQGQTSPVKNNIFSKLLEKGKTTFGKLKANSFPNLLRNPKISKIKEQQLNNSLYQKAKLKEKMMKSLQDFKVAQNPEQIANELLAVLLDPLKASLNKAPKKPLVKPVRAKLSEITLTIDDKKYYINGYSNDKKYLVATDAKGNKFQIAADRNFKLDLTSDSIKFSKPQKELLDKNNPLKGKYKDLDVIFKKGLGEDIEITTATTTQLFQNNQKQSEGIGIQKNSINI